MPLASVGKPYTVFTGPLGDPGPEPPFWPLCLRAGLVARSLSSAPSSVTASVDFPASHCQYARGDTSHTAAASAWVIPRRRRAALSCSGSGISVSFLPFRQLALGLLGDSAIFFGRRNGPEQGESPNAIASVLLIVRASGGAPSRRTPQPEKVRALRTSRRSGGRVAGESAP